MDKKTKLWLGAGIVGVGAYLLWKSKQTAAPAITKASMVGFNSVGDNEKFTNAVGSDFAGVEPRLMNANGDFAGVGDSEKFNAGGPVGDGTANFKNQNGNQYSKEFFDVQDSNYANALGWPWKKKKKGKTMSVTVEDLGGEYLSQNGNQYSKEFFDVKGGKLGVESGLFKKPMSGKMSLVGTENDTPREKFNQTGSSPFKHVVLKGNKPAQDTTAKKAAQLVGANGAPTFFAPRTARFGKDQGIFAPSNGFFAKTKPVEPPRKSPVEPSVPTMVTQKAPINNMVGLINEAEVKDSGWVK
jgi:hypothetical protein